MKQERFNYLPTGLVADEQTPFNEACAHSLFISRGFKLNYARIIAPLAPNVMRGEMLGHLWHDIAPIDGTYTFEIGCEILYFLPNIEGKAEYMLTVNEHEYIICNRMVKAFLGGDEATQNDNLDYILLHRLALPQLMEKKELTPVHPIPAKTFVSRQFTCVAQTAESAIEENFIQWHNEIIADISHLLEVMRVVATGDAHPFLPLSQAFAPLFWVVVTGKDGKVGYEQFTDNIWFVTHKSPHHLQGDTANELQQLLLGEKNITPSQAALSLAHTFMFYGYLDLAIVQACIACETYLSKRFNEYIITRGVSKNQLKENVNVDDITFSQLLNLHLPCMIDLTTLPDHSRLLGNINWARKRRNDIVHQGKSREELEKKRVQEVLESFDTLLSRI